MATTIYVGMTEGGPANVVFTMAVICAVGALVTMISQRILHATFVAAAMVALLCTIAYFKQETTDVTLHAYDAVSLLTSWTALRDLWHNQSRYVIAVLLMLMVMAGLGWAAYRVDGSRVRRRHAVGAAALCAIATLMSADPSDGKLHKLRVETYGGASWLTSGPFTKHR